MAIVNVTRYSVDARAWPRLSQGVAVSALAASDGASVDIALDMTARHMPPAPAAGLYRIVVVGGDARVTVGPGAVADENSEYWIAGSTEMRFVQKGTRISVRAA